MFLEGYKFAGLSFTWWLTLGWRVADDIGCIVLYIGPIGFIFAEED